MTENPEVRNPPGTNGKREAPRHPENAGAGEEKSGMGSWLSGILRPGRK